MLINHKGRRGPGTDDEFSTSGRRLAILFATSLLTLPYVIHCTSFFYATYGFLVACGYETKRLGIYNFSCLFEERSDRLSEMVEQSIDRRREKGCKRFIFLLFLSFTRVLYIMCIVFFFCVTSLCASILFHRVIVQALSLVECRPLDQFLIDYN